MAVGICLSLVFRERPHDDAGDTVRKDTVFLHDTVRYTRWELASQTMQLTAPKVSVPEFVFIPEEKTIVVYRDSISYVMAPRSYYYTRTHDAEIWHSGVDSRIDSLAVIRSGAMVTGVVSDKPLRHSLTAYGEVGYMEGISMKAGMRYLYHPQKWMGMGFSVERDFALKQTGIYGNLELTIGWN